MAARIEDDFMTAEYDGRVIASARSRPESMTSCWPSLTSIVRGFGVLLALPHVAETLRKLARAASTRSPPE